MKLLTWNLARSWRGLLGWMAGLAASILLNLPFYPSIGGTELPELVLNFLPEEFVKLAGLDRIGTGAGFVQASHFEMTGFLLVAIAAVSWGSQLLAGREEDGSLELALARGVSRRRLLLEAAATLALKLAALNAAGSFLILLLNGPSQLDLEPLNLAAVTVALFLLSLVVGLTALAGGAVTGRRGTATTAATIVAVGAYALNALGLVADLPGVAAFSPLHWAFEGEPLFSGFSWAGPSKLLAAAAVLLALALWRFSVRDING